jgi:hypothetical protein
MEVFDLSSSLAQRFSQSFVILETTSFRPASASFAGRSFPSEDLIASVTGGGAFSSLTGAAPARVRGDGCEVARRGETFVLPFAGDVKAAVREPPATGGTGELPFALRK